MNRRHVAAVAAAAAVALVGVAGAFGAAGLGPGAAPADPETPTPTGPDGTTLVHDGDVVTLENDPGQVVSGPTDLEAGTELVVRLKSTDGSSPFLKSATTTVADNGTFRATFDMSGLPAGTSFSAVVYHDGENVTTASGEVVEGTVPERTPTPEDHAVTLDYEGDAVTLTNDSEQVVAGTADLDAGTEVVVQLRSSGGRQPFIKSTTAVVGDDGGFEATFDMSGIEPGAEFTVTVRHDGETVGEASGEVVDSS